MGIRIEDYPDPLPPVGHYVYQLTRLRASSDKYGPCEVCHQHVTDVHLQAEGHVYEPGEITHYECRNLFGHRECLEGARRGGTTCTSP